MPQSNLEVHIGAEGQIVWHCVKMTELRSAVHECVWWKLGLHAFVSIRWLVYRESNAVNRFNGNEPADKM